MSKTWFLSGLGVLSFAGLMFAQGGCGEEIRCNGFMATDSRNAPEITRIEKLKQMPGDPWTIIMSLYFIDRDGDLASGDGEDTGVMNFFLNGGMEASSQGMDAVFEQSALGGSETNGNGWFAIRFDDTSTPDGARVNFETQLVDASGNRSNCYVVNLNFDVTE